MQHARLRPILASEFITFPPAYKAPLVEYGGAVAVNDKILPLWEEIFDIALLYGGRGGGKSEAVCDWLIDRCMNDEYYKCYYGRKVFDTVRGSCFATLVASIKKLKLEAYFTFSEAESSSMVITCKHNGNKFIPFGSDKPDKLKSIKDPTHIWCEEFDQFAFTDFSEFYPTLRTIRGDNILIATFNTEKVLPNHWLLKLFFPSLYEADEDNTVDVPEDLLKGTSILEVFVNYDDNYFIDQKRYRQLLWLASAGNETIFEGKANGAWGIDVNESPWLYAFDRKKHIAPAELHATRSQPLYLCFDFNRNPQACTIIQWYDDTVFIIDVIKEKNIGTEGICEIIKDKYPGYLYIVTGDYSGDTVSSLHKEQVTNYTIIRNMLKLSKGQIRITPNPPLAKNKQLVNTIFFGYKVQVCPVKGRKFTFDAEKVRTRADGSIVKDDRDDPKQQADVLDTVRYFFNMFFGWYLKLMLKETYREDK